MGRHSATLSPGRRYTGVALGVGTILILAGVLWEIAAGEPAVTTSTVAVAASLPTTLPTPTSTAPEIPATSPPSTLAATTQPPTTTAAPFPVVLESSGLGVAQLGTGFDEAYVALTDVLGSPDRGSGWVSATSEQFGTCPGTVLRVVQWQSLRAFFSDGPTEFGEGERHFFYYSQSVVETATVLDLRTARDVGVGTSVADLRAAYGESLVVDTSSEFGATFVIRSGQRGLLSGTLSESSDEGQVTSLAGGFGCGST